MSALSLDQSIKAPPAPGIWRDQLMAAELVFVNLLRSSGIDSQPGWPVRQPYLTYRRPARLHRLAKSITWNRFLGSLNVYKSGLWMRRPLIEPIDQGTSFRPRYLHWSTDSSLMTISHESNWLRLFSPKPQVYALITDYSWSLKDYYSLKKLVKDPRIQLQVQVLALISWLKLYENFQSWAIPILRQLIKKEIKVQVWHEKYVDMEWSIFPEPSIPGSPYAWSNRPDISSAKYLSCYNGTTCQGCRTAKVKTSSWGNWSRHLQLLVV